MTFASREQAGKQLGGLLLGRGVAVDLVLGLPRGGVVVAVEVARLLGRPMDVIVVRKIGHPRQREFAVGALAEPGIVRLDQAALAEFRVLPAQLAEVIMEETGRLRTYIAKFHPGAPLELAGKNVLLIDDGLATGASAEAAAASVRQQEAARVLIAVPVASPGGVQRLARVADEVIALHIDPDFAAVGQYYQNFGQTTDEEVLAMLPIHA
jgi:putative phosphoribosyl transferase